MKKKFTFLIAALMLLAMISQPTRSCGQTKITSINDIVSGKTYYIGATLSNNTDYYLSANHGSNNTVAGTGVTSTENASTFTFEGSGASWTIKFDNGKYLSLPNSDNNGKVVVQADEAIWTASDQSNLIRLEINNHYLQKNTSTNTAAFGSYRKTSNQKNVWLEEVSSGPEDLATPVLGETPTVGLNSVTISWESVSHATKYELQYDTNSDFSSPTTASNNISSDATSYTVNDLSASNTFYFRLMAIGDGGTNYNDSDWSEPVSAQPLAYITLDPPTLIAEPGNGQVVLSWETITNAISYTIAYTTDTDNWNMFENISNITTTSYTITNLNNGTTYYFKAKTIGNGTTYHDSDFCADVDATPNNTVTITITRASITETINGYNHYNWTAGGIFGKVYAYQNNNGIQTNTPSNSGGNLYNTDPVPGVIKSVRMKKESGTTRTWYLRVHTSGITTTSGGTQIGNGQSVGTDWVSWDVTGNYNYFLLYDNGATVISTIEITYEPSPTYVVRIPTPSYGSITVKKNGTAISNGDEVYEGANMTLVASPNDNYALRSLNVYKTDDETPVEVTDNAFTMPGYPITIAANFDLLQTVECLPDLTGGSVSADPTSCLSGTVVTVTAYPLTHYHLDSWYVLDGDAEEVEVTPDGSNPNKATFTMPAKGVTVSATFEEDSKVTITYNENGTPITDDVYPGMVTLAEDPVTTPANMSFYGWAKSDVTKFTDEAPTVFTSDNITSDITFYAVYKYDYSYTIGGGTPTWTKVTDASTLAANDILVIASDDNATSVVAGDISSQIMGTVDAEFKVIGDNTVMSSLPTDGVELTLGGTTDSWTLSNASDQLLGATAEKKLAWGSGTTTWSISISNGNATIQNGTNSYGRFLYNVGSPRFTTYTSQTSETMLLPQLYRLENGGATINGTYYITSYTTISSETTIAKNDVTNLIDNVTIDPESGSYIVNGSLNADGYLIANPTASKIVVNNGGQLILGNSNTGVKATVKKTISAVPSSKDPTNKGWYSISSPVDNASVVDNTNLVTASAYDLYMFDESKEDLQWINYNQINSTHGFTNMTNGRGYIYRNAAAVTATYTGTVNAADIECLVTKTENTPFSGFNLVGNPYTQKIKLANTQLLNGTTPLDGENQLVGFYVADINGGWGTQLGTDNEIDPAQGFLVQVPENATKIKFSTTKFRSRANADNIMFTVENSEYSDVTYALFDKGYGLSKINHRNSEIPMLYIPQNDENYAIAMMSDDTKAFNLNFEAKTAGRYTLSFKANGEFNYLHVIDRMTGEDVDMLLEGEYSFIGSPMDNANRFIVRLGYLPNYDDNGEDIFAYQNGSDIVVSGEGELQIFDVMGRMISAQRVNGVETINLNAKGVYVFKLNEKTQKIVVK